MNLDNYFLQLKSTELEPWASHFLSYTLDHFCGVHKESLHQWKETIDAMPEISPASMNMNDSVVSVQSATGLSPETVEAIEKGFRSLNPWRKGPFDICGVFIDSEWRSDLKWDRLKDKIAPLDKRLVLDVGCGNGYHCFRALGAGADFVMGIDHKLTFFGQNQALLKYLKTDRAAVLPLSLEDMPHDCDVFDTIFSMGVLYHVHSPIEHLIQLKSLLRRQGQVVLETLVIDGEEGEILHPRERYARMANVRNIPSCKTVMFWLRKSGFENIQMIDVSPTTTEEQHTNQWGVWQSLEHFLDPQDASRTVEGYPAPVRAIFLAEK